MVGRWSFRSSCTGESPFIAIQIFELPEKREGKYKDYFLPHMKNLRKQNENSVTKPAVLDIGGNGSLKRVRTIIDPNAECTKTLLTESGY